MTWNEKRIVTALSTILAILTAALLVVLSIRYRENREQQAETTTVTPQGVVVSKEDYLQLYVENGSFSPTFAKNEQGSWTWADQPDFPLNSETVAAILAILDDPQPQQTLPLEGELSDYALESPRATAIATRGDGSTRSILLGKPTTDGQSYYALIDGDETTVYILPGQLYQLLLTPVYDMMELPVLPELRPDSLSDITIQGRLGDNAAAQVLTLTARQEGGKDNLTRWFAGEEEVTDSPLVQGLLEDLRDLTVTRCVDFNPSEGAVDICGLNDPAAVLTVTYLTEAGAQQQLKLSVGQRVTDGSGRYMQLDDDSTIYFLPTALLDPLMHIAAIGLDA